MRNQQLPDSNNNNTRLMAVFRNNQWLNYEKVGNAPSSSFSLLFPPLPCHETAPWKPAGGLGECCNTVPVFKKSSRPQTHLGVFWARKLHLCIYLTLKWCVLKHFTNALRKNSCIAKKWQNSVPVFKKSSRTSLRRVLAQFKHWGQRE